MKTIVAVLFASFVADNFSPERAPASPLQEYTIDAGHSIVEFSIPFAFSRVKGRLTQSKGTILYDAANPSKSSITFITEAKSLDTGWPHRDEHLRTSDFFDVEKYPTIEFHSEKFRQSQSRWIVDGQLTMHGVTKRVSIPFRLLHPPTRGKLSGWMMMNVAGEVRLARADFGIFGGSQFNSWFNKARAATMGDSVDVSMEIESYYADPQSQRSAGIVASLERIKTGGAQAQLDKLTEWQKTKSPAEFKQYFTGHDLIVRGLIEAGDLKNAVALAKALTEFFPDQHAARLVYGFALATSGDKAGSAREYAKAKAIFRAPVVDPNEKFPQDDETWWYMDQLARAAVMEWGRAAEAVVLARTISELYPTNARAFTTYGQALAASGDTRGAAVQYAKALQMDPMNTRAWEWKRRLAA
ncbi:MAG TPA: YceI family protein [Longimicrobiales bacterium]|nr:YceI family protein [Longimicrobiales bacterium]